MSQCYAFANLNDAVSRVSEEILINVTPSESRVAVVESGMLQDIWLERAGRNGYLGNIYRGQVIRVLPGLQAAFLEIGLGRTAFLHASDMVRRNPELPEGELPAEPLISDQLRAGDELTVQVIKDPLGDKGARLSTNVSLPSRFLVLLPNNGVVAISARIEDEAERERLRSLVETLRAGEDRHGFIVRTNAEGVDEFALAADMTYLRKLWSVVEERCNAATAPSAVYEDLSLPLRALRDLMHESVERVRIDCPRMTGEARAFARSFLPTWLDRIEEYRSERPIFDLFGVEDEIESALQRMTPLKSGGYLVFDQTEAMTTIDVNTGACVGYRNLAETVYKTNLEAAQAIARQLRVRNLGGIIIIDFIDMEREEHRRQVLRALEHALEKDLARTKVIGMTELGLAQMTRKRTTESLANRLCEPCPICEGRGTLKSIETVVLEIFREIMRSSRQFGARELPVELLVLAAPQVVDRILDEQSASVAELEEIVGKSIRFQREDQYSREQFDVVLV
jgi:ribonuclease G